MKIRIKKLNLKIISLIDKIEVSIEKVIEQEEKRNVTEKCNEVERVVNITKKVSNKDALCQRGYPSQHKRLIS